jgi:hypothetical protein
VSRHGFDSLSILAIATSLAAGFPALAPSPVRAQDAPPAATTPAATTPPDAAGSTASDPAAETTTTTTTTTTTASTTSSTEPATATAAVEGEEAGRSRVGYAWGEGPAEEAGPSGPAYHRFGHAFVSAGAGGSVRIVAHADVCNPDQPGREACRFSPPYLQLRGGWFFEGDDPIQHGVGLGVATNLAPDGLNSEGIDPLAQWALSPSYFMRIWLGPWFQLMGHFGVPLVISAVSGNPSKAGTAFNWGVELQAGGIFKFLTGLGVYLEVGVAAFFAGSGSVWPTLSFEGGLVFDYEVLP